jgi:uncharacterized membrane protein YgcG
MKTEIPEEIDVKKITLRDLVKISDNSVEDEQNKKPIKPITRSLDSSDAKENNKKSGLLEAFLTPFQDNFAKLKNSWSSLPPQEAKEYAESVSKSLTQKFDQAFDNSSPKQKQRFENLGRKISGRDDSNKIKLDGDKNSLEQLAELGVDLKKLNNKINMTTIVNPFSAEGQKTPIKVMTKDGEKEVMIDVQKFAKDAVEFNQKQANEETKIPLNKALELYGKKQSGALSEQEKVDANKLQESADKADKSNAIRRQDFLKKVDGVRGINPPSLSNSNQGSSWRERVGGDSVGGSKSGGVSKGGAGSRGG